ncbi:carbon-nitrogen hydrolase family protein [Bifidobacterium pullorum]|uniref:carbon-nitrogen hydrolase family protein n=1 Tax=Bifidobacterium pullorum TaxID=78448 RepID=UPI003AF84780
MSDSHALTIAMAQYGQLAVGERFERFADSVRSIVEQSPGQRPDIVVFPEMHLFGTGDADRDAARRMQAAATTNLHDGLTDELAALARECGIWLIPGTVCESNPSGDDYNTALVFSPSGELAASYRKICPWRPYEWYTPGDSFTVFEIPGIGCIGLTICYDAWFPEISRQVAWMGAELIINLVRTTTPDRAQELVLARANAIVNQTALISLNAAAPQGVGRSIVVDPEGSVIAETEDDRETLLFTTIDFDAIRNVREHGTAGLNRPWQQFRHSDGIIPLPMYDGCINADTWKPRR